MSLCVNLFCLSTTSCCYSLSLVSSLTSVSHSSPGRLLSTLPHPLVSRYREGEKSVPGTWELLHKYLLKGGGGGLEFMRLQLAEEEALGWTRRRICLCTGRSRGGGVLRQPTQWANKMRLKHPPPPLACLIPLCSVSLLLRCKAFSVG